MAFLNGLGKKFTNAARSVQEMTRDSVENSRLAADLRTAMEELDRRYTELGRAYYESLDFAETKAPEAEIAAVREALRRVDNLTLQRDRLNRQARCPGCGAVQSDEARYCSNCGRPMPEPDPEEPAPDVGVEYCCRCGAMRQEQARFCALCGEAFDPADQTPELPAVTAAPAAEPAEEPDFAEDME